MEAYDGPEPSFATSRRVSLIDSTENPTIRETFPFTIYSLILGELLAYSPTFSDKSSVD
jgi:hypothetical protein